MGVIVGKLDACDAVEMVRETVVGLPAFLTGSAVAACVHDKQQAYSDVDLFTPNQGSYFAVVQHLLNHGFEIGSERYAKIWRRHLKVGFRSWHTNSMMVKHVLSGLEVNVVFKMVDGHPTTQLSQVLESFDFGLLAAGYDLSLGGRFFDMRSYFFGDGAGDGRALPMLPYREEAIRQGLMSQHVMLRMPGRYARYAHTYGYDLSLVKPVLVAGYEEYAAYMLDRSKDEQLVLGQIAARLGSHLRANEFDALLKFEKSLPTADGLDEIMEGLE